jgi:hypothetical protein
MVRRSEKPQAIAFRTAVHCKLWNTLPHKFAFVQVVCQYQRPLLTSRRLTRQVRQLLIFSSQ